jgi:hypothetical protein
MLTEPMNRQAEASSQTALEIMLKGKMSVFGKNEQKEVCGPSKNINFCPTITLELFMRLSLKGF